MKSDGTAAPSTPLRINYYHSDHLGSSNIITDENGDKVASYEYQPYGEISDQSPINQSPINHYFTGKELDSSTGLYYYGARYYDPEIGRFITADPTVQRPYDPQDLNRYAYCRNNPINLIDPTGYGFKDFLGKIVGAIVGVAVLVATGNPVLAFAAFNITDTVISGAQALYYGADPGRVFGAIGMSIGLNLLIPGPDPSGDFWWQVVAGGVRGAMISSAVTAAFGGDIGEAAAWGGGMGALAGAVGAWSSPKSNKNASTSDDVVEQTAKDNPDDLQAPIDAGNAQEGPSGAMRGGAAVAEQNSNADIRKVGKEVTIDQKLIPPEPWPTFGKKSFKNLFSLNKKITYKVYHLETRDMSGVWQTMPGSETIITLDVRYSLKILGHDLMDFVIFRRRK